MAFGNVIARPFGKLFDPRAALPGFALNDSFTDTDGVRLASHVIAPSNTPATSWTENVGTWTIQSNRVSIASGATGIATLDAGIADCVISVYGKIASGSDTFGIAMRFTATNAYWFVRFNTTGFAIFEVNGTTTNRRQSLFAITTGVDHLLVVTLAGSTISATLDGSDPPISYASATFNQTVTRHGLRCLSNVTGNANGDNFVVTV